ncbi:MAG: WD40 repeat domain-containing protein, partial [Spirulina sp.]
MSGSRKMLKKVLVIVVLGLTGLAPRRTVSGVSPREPAIATTSQTQIFLSSSAKTDDAFSLPSFEPEPKAFNANIQRSDTQISARRTIPIRDRLETHQDLVMSAAWSPDSQILASGSWDKTIKIWSREGHLLRTLTGHEREIYSVAWSPDGTMLASGSDDRTVKIWSREGELLHTLKGHQSRVESVAWSPDSQLLASAGSGGFRDSDGIVQIVGILKIWSREGDLLQTLTGHRDAINSIAWSPDGRTLVSASRTLKIWSRDGKLLETWTGHEEAIASVAWSPDGEMLASGDGEGILKVWSRSGKQLHSFRAHGEAGSSAEWGPDGQTTFQTHYYSIESVAWSPDGQTLASASNDKTIKIWSLEGELRHTLE